MAGFTGDQLFFPVSFFCDHVRLLHLFLRAYGKKNLTSHNEAVGSFRGEAKHFFPGLLGRTHLFYHSCHCHYTVLHF